MKNTEIEHKTNFDLILYNTLRISSIAEDVYFPKTKEEFTLLLANLDNPLVVGRGSNVLFSSTGTKRPVIVTKCLNKIDITPPFFVAGTGVAASKLAEMALELKLTGFEFLSSLPATVGGAVCMNAGACGQTISDCFESAEVYDSNEDKTLTFARKEMKFEYRNSSLKNQERYFLLDVKFKLNEEESYETIQKKMDDCIKMRQELQPSLKNPNLGSVFKNPENASAGKLLDECGMKGVLYGGAMVYFKHANFIINFNNATSFDYLCLMRLMQKNVFEKFNTKLRPEIIYAGEDKKEVEIWKEINQ